MKKDKIKILSIIFMSVALFSVFSWDLIFVSKIQLLELCTSSAFFTVLFLPVVIAVYVGSVIGVIGVPTYLGITMMVLNIVRICRSSDEKYSIKFNVFQICFGFGIILLTGIMYYTMGI